MSNERNLTLPRGLFIERSEGSNRVWLRRLYDEADQRRGSNSWLHEGLSNAAVKAALETPVEWALMKRRQRLSAVETQLAALRVKQEVLMAEQDVVVGDVLALEKMERAQ